ncbi:MAG: hypothetical protein N2234_02505 [Planctomycetota bacterium]|nr:hypothetical protein [Planctomycetota bacterium]
MAINVKEQVMVLVGFAVGLVVGFLIHYAWKEREANAEKKAIEKLKQQNEDLKSALESERSRAKSVQEKFEEKMDELVRQLHSKDSELSNLQVEVKSLKEKMEELNRTKPSPSVAKLEEKKPEERGAEQKALVDELKDLLTLIEKSPSDRTLMRSFADKVWNLKDVAVLKEFVERLKKLYTDSLTADADNLDLLFNEGLVCAVELTYLQQKMKEDPMTYGPKMGEVALKAKNCFDKVISKNPNDNDALLVRAWWCLYSPGEIKQAETDFVELVKRAKEQNFEQSVGERVFLGAAMTYQKLGKKEEAKKTVEEGMNLYPHSESLRKFYNKLFE